MANDLSLGSSEEEHPGSGTGVLHTPHVAQAQGGQTHRREGKVTVEAEAGAM